jgi:hypothetical protein
MDIKEMVGADKKVRFIYWRANELWYEAENGFQFPVQTHDAGTATFLAEDKSIFFMRYIRKHLKNIEEGAQDSEKV